MTAGAAADPVQPRLPDFVVIGTMKSGTTTLHDRVSSHPGVLRHDLKEPNFFSDESAWRRGPAWYGEVYARPSGIAALDASVRYTDPELSAVAAERIEATLPRAPLVALVRHPVDRARSHYLHEVQRRRERRPFPVAVTMDSTYVQTSRYLRCLGPYLDGPLAQNLLVLRTEDLDEPAAWGRVLAHLGLEPIPLSIGHRNEGASKEVFTSLGSALWERGLLQRAGRIPKPLRRLGRKVAMRHDGEADALRASADAALDSAIEAALLDESDELGRVLDLDTSTWHR